MKFAIVDYRHLDFHQKLRNIGYEVIPFSAQGLVYRAIEGHADIFIFSTSSHFIVAPNTPSNILDFFDNNNIKYSFGLKPVGFGYPDSVVYNAYLDNEVAILHPYVDESIIQLIHHQKVIHVKQGYVRCNVFRIGNSYITSDVQIHHSLLKEGHVSHYVFPKNIFLPTVKHGFIGGCFGQHHDLVFFTGSKVFSYALLFEKLVSLAGKKLFYLGKDNPIDVGGLFFFG